MRIFDTDLSKQLRAKCRCSQVEGCGKCLECRAADAIARLTLTWTDTLPTEPSEDCLYLCRTQIFSGGWSKYHIRHGYDIGRAFFESGGQIAGPIPEPKEPTP